MRSYCLFSSHILVPRHTCWCNINKWSYSGCSMVFGIWGYYRLPSSFNYIICMYSDPKFKQALASLKMFPVVLRLQPYNQRVFLGERKREEKISMKNSELTHHWISFFNAGKNKKKNKILDVVPLNSNINQLNR